jgi:predicted nucleotidyltransferase
LRKRELLDAASIPSRYPNGYAEEASRYYFNAEKQKRRSMQPGQSSNSVKIISLDPNRLLKQVRDAVGQIRANHPEVAEVRLFGSLARGDATGVSDVDLLIVLSDTDEKDPHRRILTYLPYFALDRGVDLLVLTQGEIDRRLGDNDRWLGRVWAESVAL